jgi:hypothetical protein
MSKLDLAEQAEPNTPSGGRVVLFAGTDSVLKYKDDAGFVTNLSAGTSGLTFGNFAAASPIAISTGTATATWSHGTSGVATGTYGGASSIPQIVVNTYGHVTSGTSISINITSGTYTPTLSNTTNVGASTASVCQYLRVGSTVTVSGKVAIDPTTGGGTTTLLGMSIPIASNFSGDTQAGGSAMADATGQLLTTTGFAHLAIKADAANDRVSFAGLAYHDANVEYWFSFTYTVI